MVSVYPIIFGQANEIHTTRRFTLSARPERYNFTYIPKNESRFSVLFKDTYSRRNVFGYINVFLRII